MTKRTPEELQKHLDQAFRLDRSRIHLNAMVLASQPEAVRNEVARHRDEIQKDPAGYILNKRNKTDKTRIIREGADTATAAAKYLGLEDVLTQRGLVPADFIAQTTSTTAGLAMLACGVKIKPGQEVLISMHDFSAHRAAWQLRADHGDLRYREFRMYEGKETSAADLGDRIVAAVEKQIRERTRVLALTWVDSGTGVKLPVARIAALVKAVNDRRTLTDRILFVLDAVHGFGVEDTTFEDLGCDFFVAGCHKWIFAPSGTGLVCASPEAWAQISPLVPSFLGSRNQGFLHSPGGIGAYEHAWAVDAAFEFHLDLEKDVVERRTITLAERLKTGLSNMKHVRLVTPMSRDLSSAIVCCAVRDYVEEEDYIALQAQLADENVMAMTSHDADGHYFLRFSPSLHNTESEIDQALAALTKVIGP